MSQTPDPAEPSPVTGDHLTLLLNAYWEWNDCDHGAPGIHPKRPFGNSNVRGDLAELLPDLSEDAREEVFRELPTVIVYMARHWPAATPAAQSATEMCSCYSTTVVRIHSSGSYCGDGQHERLSEALAERLTLDIDQRGDANAELCASAVLDALRKEPTPVAQSAAEPAYRCGQCGATGCRLFRPYQTFIDSGSLRCAACAAASEGIDNADLRAGQIGWYVLAVPTTPGYDSFWGYTSGPAEPLAWWRSLPVRPTAAGGAS